MSREAAEQSLWLGRTKTSSSSVKGKIVSNWAGCIPALTWQHSCEAQRIQPKAQLSISITRSTLAANLPHVPKVTVGLEGWHRDCQTNRDTQRGLHPPGLLTSSSPCSFPAPQTQEKDQAQEKG